MNDYDKKEIHPIAKFAKSSLGKMIFGFLFVAVAVVLLLLNSAIIGVEKDYDSTRGEVVGYDYKQEDGNSLYAELVEFYVNGKLYECQSSRYSTEPKKIGSKITVRYNPNNPHKANAYSDAGNVIVYIVSGICGTGGLILIGGGIRQIVEERQR